MKNMPFIVFSLVTLWLLPACTNQSPSYTLKNGQDRSQVVDILKAIAATDIGGHEQVMSLNGAANHPEGHRWDLGDYGEVLVTVFEDDRLAEMFLSSRPQSKQILPGTPESASSLTLSPNMKPEYIEAK
jgi:hypothetical protein